MLFTLLCRFSTSERSLRSILVAVLIGLSITGCSKSPDAAANRISEPQIEASALLQVSFHAKNEYWFGAEKPPGSQQYRLAELRNAHPSILPRAVTDTDRLNGITDRFALTLTCEQVRYWSPKDRSWSKWLQGTDGVGGEIINSLLGSGLGYWLVRFEKENGVWHSKPANGRDFAADNAILARLMREAGEL